MLSSAYDSFGNVRREYNGCDLSHSVVPAAMQYRIENNESGLWVIVIVILDTSILLDDWIWSFKRSKMDSTEDPLVDLISSLFSAL
jgi:hypothetical protein